MQLANCIDGDIENDWIKIKCQAGSCVFTQDAPR